MDDPQPSSEQGKAHRLWLEYQYIQANGSARLLRNKDEDIVNSLGKPKAVVYSTGREVANSPEYQGLRWR